MTDTVTDNATTSEQAGLTLTAAAAARIKSQLDKRGHGIGLRLGVRKSGCSGYAYTMDFADEITATDNVFSGHGAQVVVDDRHLPVLQGTTVDFRRAGLNEVFHFDNPHVDSACGCGESFTV